LQRAHGGEFVAVLGERNDRRRRRLRPQASQQRQAERLRILGAGTEGRREHQQVAVVAGSARAPAFEFGEIEHADARLRAQHVQVMPQPLAVAHIVVDHHQAGARGVTARHGGASNNTRTRAR
jgi:hypothetical protein